MTDPHDAAPAAPGPAPEVRGVPAPPADAVAPSAPAPGSAAAGERPTFLFFGVVAAISLIADVTTKAWAEITLSKRNPFEPSIELVKDHLSFTLAYNKGGAWGLLQEQPELVRRPFFLLVSLLAVGFIINLYGRLLPGQRALKWGLPLVLGGALGNLADRVVRSNVIDFIDYQAAWIESMNRAIARLHRGWAITDHWPTFNVADIAICVGVGLMAVDMFTSRRGASPSLPPRPEGPAADSAAPPSPAGPAPQPAAEPARGGLKVPEPTPPLKPEA